MSSAFIKKSAAVIIAAALLTGYALIGSILGASGNFVITASADETDPGTVGGDILEEGDAWVTAESWSELA